MRTSKKHSRSLGSLLDAYLMDGKYHFTTQEACKKLGKSLPAVRAALRRAMHGKKIAMPYKGFWVIVPPEYRRLECLPAQEFIPQLMEFLGEPYHAGLLTAAQFHGVAHQQPQVFQVVVKKNRPEINCAKVNVSFIARKEVDAVPVIELNTARGHIKVSTPEATALEIVGYPDQCGGMDNVAALVAGLAEKIDPVLLEKIVVDSPKAWVQRLGFLLEKFTEMDTGLLEKFVGGNVKSFVPLVPSKPIRGAQRSPKWKLLVNAKLEPDI